MILLFFAVAMVLPLWLYAPAPVSLHEVGRPGLGDRIRSTAGTLGLGLVMLLVAAAVFNSENRIDPEPMVIFALSRSGIFESGAIFQLLTANLLHDDLPHLAANLSLLVLLSAYERRVGWRRHVMVYGVSAVGSSMAVLAWLPPQAVFMGASGGISGLAAAYLLDQRGMGKAEWAKGSLVVLLIVGLCSLSPSDSSPLQGVAIAAHLAGALAGAAYTYLVRWAPSAT